MKILGRIAIAGACAAVLAMSSAALSAQARGQAAAPAAAPAPAPAEPLSALAPENLAKPRPKAPFDLTGNWFVDTSAGPDAWRFGPPYPKLTPKAQKEFDTGMKYMKEGKIYKDDIGQCWPAGLPLIMTRYWPTAMIQLPTAVYMVSEFMNSFRTIFLDGREHSDKDVVVRTPNGESIGHWEGDTMVVDTQFFRGDHHWMDQGGASIPAGEQLHIVERIRLLPGGKQLEIAYTMTDPENWVGEWKSTKKFNRVNDIDIHEVECLPDLNDHLKSTRSKTQVK
jgi:hypothetical protein